MRGGSCRRRHLTWGAALFLAAAPAPAQVLNLGDPAPPAPSTLSAGRALAVSLREQARALRSAAQIGSTPKHAAVCEAQAKWRDLAAILLDSADPLTEHERALPGWILASAAAALDADIAKSAEAPGLDAEAREDSLWMLHRFSASPLGETDTADQEALSQAAELLCEALAPLTPQRGPAVDELDALRRRLEDDPDLHRAAEWLERAARRVRSGGTLSPRERTSLSLLARAIDGVETLDRAAWLASVWAPNRARAADEAIAEALNAPRGAARPSLQAIDSIAGAVQRLDALDQYPPEKRLRAAAYLDAVRRWARMSLEEGAEPPWPMMYDALDSADARRAAAAAAGPRELRIACKALDDQSDRLEALMGEALRRLSSAGQASDPAWATLIGGHRRNIIERRMLIELPAAIDAAARFDRRTPAALWPRLSAAAARVDDERQREHLAALARAIGEFSPSCLQFEDEAAWRDDGSWAADLIGPERAAVLQRLDTLRAARAAELVNAETPADPARSDAAQDLAALRDLFRLAATWRTLEAAGPEVAGRCRRLGLLCSAALGARSAAALREEVRRAAAGAARGGPAFRRAVEDARRRSADAIVLADLAGRAEAAPAGEVPIYFDALERLADGQLDARGAGERARLAQWCLLHLESTDSEMPAAAGTYRDLLARRLAEAIWSRAE